MNRKVTVVGGAGNVGATVARGVADKQLADVVVIDIADQKAAGIALDMLEACPICGSDARVMGTSDYAESAGSDVVVITSGVPRKPGMSRDDLLNVNFKIMQQVTEQVVKYSPNCIIIPVANPLDAMAQAIYKLQQVSARAGHRHGGRARLGAHARVHREGAGRVGRERPRLRARRPRRHDGPAAALFDRRRHSDHGPDGQGDDRSDRAHGTASGGAEITELVGTSAWYAPGASAVEMVEAILLDKKKILPCSVFLQGEYGVRDLFVGVPCKLGARGLEKIIEIKLTPDEDAAFKKSAAAVKELVDVIKV